MIGTLQTQKKIIEGGNNSVRPEILVVNIDEKGFSSAFFSKDLDILKIADVALREPAKNGEEMASGFLHLVDELELKRTHFTSIQINWLGKNFTLVPNSFYKTEKAKDTLEFNTGKIVGESVCVNEVRSDIKLVFSVPTELKNTIDKTFPHHDLKHTGACSITHFFTHFQLKKADIFLNIHDAAIELLVKKEKQLLLYNIFSAKTNEDILYYLMFAIEQFKLDPAHLNLMVSANRETNDELFLNLKKYVRHVNFAVSDKIIKRNDVFEKLPHHYYFSLLNRPVCE